MKLLWLRLMVCVMESEEQKWMLAGVRRGERRACDQLVQFAFPLVYRYFCRAWRATSAEAEELAQDTFAEIWTSLKRYRGGSLRAWILTIARRLAWKAFREQATVMRDENPEDVDTFADAGPTLEELVSMKQQLEKLRQLIAMLSPRYQEVLYLYYLEELSTEEIAQMMELPASTTRTRLQRARDQLRQQWQNLEKSQEQS